MTGKMKLKLLLEKDYLEKYSDESRPVGAEELMAMLREHGIEIERKSVYADAKLLKQAGVKIKFVRHPSSGYYVETRKFSANELRFLIDSIRASASISQETTDELIQKLGTLCSENQLKKLCSDHYIESSFKTKNDKALENLQIINDAIETGRKILFSYKRKKLSSDGTSIESYVKEYLATPFAVVVSDDHYYLVCYAKGKRQISHFRIDKIVSIEKTKIKGIPFSKVTKYTKFFDVDDYCASLFHMYSAETIQPVEILCSRDIIDPVYDRFGSKAEYIAVNRRTFKLRMDAHISDGLVSWIMEYGDNMTVLQPAELKSMVHDKAQAIAAKYEK